MPIPRPLPEIRTPRLLLRPLTTDDAPAIQLLLPHWAMVRHLDAKLPWPYPADGAATFVAGALPQIAAGTLAVWSIRSANDPAVLMGSISLHPSSDAHRGFWMGLPFQGQGYMTEAAEAVTQFWFEVCQQSVLRVRKAEGNTPSQRLSQREGMRVVGTTVKPHVGGLMSSTLYEITAEEWRARRDRQALAQEHVAQETETGAVGDWPAGPYRPSSGTRPAPSR